MCPVQLYLRSLVTFYSNFNILFFLVQYRDVVRQFVKGTDGFAGAFAECLCGSPSLYQVSLLLLYYQCS